MLLYTFRTGYIRFCLLFTYLLYTLKTSREERRTHTEHFILSHHHATNVHIVGVVWIKRTAKYSYREVVAIEKINDISLNVYTTRRVVCNFAFGFILCKSNKSTFDSIFVYVYVDRHCPPLLYNTSISSNRYLYIIISRRRCAIYENVSKCKAVKFSRMNFASQMAGYVKWLETWTLNKFNRLACLVI